VRNFTNVIFTFSYEMALAAILSSGILILLQTQPSFINALYLAVCRQL